jgi:hypothetical protein
VLSLLKAHTPIKQITAWRAPHYVMSHVTFSHLRRIDAEIDALAVPIIEGAQPRYMRCDLLGIVLSDAARRILPLRPSRYSRR